MKVKNDHCSEFSNLSNWKEEAWKNQGFNRIRTRDLRVAGALMLYQLSYEATHWKRGQFIEFISPVSSSVGRATHRQCGGHGFESRWSPDFFRFLLSNCLNWKIHCDDHSSLSSITTVQNELFHIFHIISLLTGDMNSINWPRSQCVAS